MASPQKYRKLGDFRDYYNKQSKFPWPVYFIAGNHEPYGWYEEHVNGFELTEGCHYLGRVSCQEIHGIKVVGISGIYSESKFTSQRPDISEFGYVSNKKYTYYNEKDIEKAMDFDSCDVLLLHDWPKGIISASDYKFLRGKRRSVNPEELGCEYTYLLIEKLNPKLLACGHMHYQYFNKIAINRNEIQICCLSLVESGSESVVIFDENLKIIV